MRIELSRSAEHFFKRAPADVARRVRERISLLASHPFPRDAIALVNERQRGASAFRIRVGHYRIKYAVLAAEQLVLVFAIDKRSRVYER